METLSPIRGTVMLDIRRQLAARNAVEVHAFREITSDYQQCLSHLRELRVRNAQLDKEAAELRRENVELSHAAHEARHGIANSQEVAEMKAEVTKLKDELAPVYKDKARLTEELMQCRETLMRVRDINEKHSNALDEATTRIRDLQARNKELSLQVDSERATQAVAASELETSRHERDEAEKKLNQMTAENADLVQRFHDMKSSEVERMNEVNRACEDMLARARSMEQQAAASLQQAPSSSSSRRTSSLTNTLRGLTMRASGSGAAAGQGAGVGLGGELEGGSAAATPMPEKATKSVSAHDGGCFTCAFDRTGNQMATAGADKVVKLWDPTTGAHIASLRGMLDTVLEVSFTADQKHLVAAGGDQALRMWDITSGRVRHTLTGHTGKVSSVDCSPSNSLRAVSSGTDRCIKLWDLNRGFCTKTIICHSSCNSVRCTRDEHIICSGHFDGTLRFWDTRSGRMANEVTGLHTQQICSIQIGTRNGTVLSCGKDNMLKTVNPQTFEVMQTLRAAQFSVGTIWCTPCISPDGQHVAAGSGNGSMFVWNMETAAVVRELKRPGAHPILASGWGPSGRPLVSCEKNGTVTFWGNA
ncbi:hypothetical protein ABBQ38_008786 [Trebouxia sp. C0009 RCD-2024]